MAKISPVSIKYMIHAKFEAIGPVEKPDVIGALFGQTEGLLGRDLELRDLQKEGKIGRIEVETESHNRQTYGTIQIPTALDQSETSLIAAAIETIDRVGPTEATITVERIEDVRGNKRDYILERAKKLLEGIEGSQTSKEISTNLKSASRTARIQEYGDEKLPCGDLSGKEIIVVEGRADVVNLLENRVDNVIGMNGTKLPKEIAKLGEEKELTLFADGDRGGKLIAKNVIENAKIKYIAFAPDGKEVEELSGKEILAALRKKIKVEEFNSSPSKSFEKNKTEIDKEKLRKIIGKVEGSKKSYLLDSELNLIKEVSAMQTARVISKTNNLGVVIVDGKVTPTIIQECENVGVKIIAGKNFASNSDKIEMISF
jgi:DNA primase